MSSIEAQLKAIAKKSMVKAEQVVRLTVNDTMNNIVIGSPVRDGLFINNWLAGYSYDQSTHKTKDKSGSKSYGSITQALNSYDLGKTFYFTNSLPYAKRLEDGHSAQAGQGMVKINVAKFDAIAQMYINQLK